MFSKIKQVYAEKGTQIILEADFSDTVSSLLQNLGSPDSDTREGSLDILWELIDSGELPAEIMLDIGNRLVKNLSIDVGEKDTDSAFLRTFSVLLVGALVVLDEKQNNAGKGFLSEETFANWFGKCKLYVLAEMDFRSYVPGKGWAHSISHGADGLRDFSAHRFTDAKDHAAVLEILADKLLQNTEQVFIYNDDNRFSRVVMVIMLRNRLGLADYDTWLNGLLNRFDGKSLLDFNGDPWQVIPWFNTLTFLRSLYFVLLHGMKCLQEGAFYEQVPELRNEVMQMVLDGLKRMDHGLNYRI